MTAKLQILIKKIRLEIKQKTQLKAMPMVKKLISQMKHQQKHQKNQKNLVKKMVAQAKHLTQVLHQQKAKELAKVKVLSLKNQLQK